MNLLPLIVVFPLIMAIILNYLYKNRFVKLLTVITLLLILIFPLVSIYGTYYFAGHGIVDGFVSGISYIYNPTKMIMVFILMLIGSLTLITSLGEKINGLTVALILLGLGSVSAIVLSDDLFNVYVFYEIAAVAQAGLVMSSGTENAYKAGFKYLIIGTLAGSLLLFGIGLLLAGTGTLNITDMHHYLANIESPSYGIYGGLLMMIIGLAYGSGLPPFHTVKANVYSEAEPYLAGILQTFSKFVLIAMIIIMFKIFGGLSYFATSQGVLIGLSIFAMVFGVVMALLQSDYKKLLSYHAISQVGYVSVGLALGTPLGIVAGIFHGINNVIYKTALFLGAHIVSKKASSDLSKIGGLLPVMPVVAFMILCAKLAISGVPPFNGFQSKLLLAESAMKANMPELTLIMIIVSIGTFVSMMKAFYLIFLKPCPDERLEEYKNIKISKYSIFSLTILTLLCILLGLYPDIVVNTIMPFAKDIGSQLVIK